MPPYAYEDYSVFLDASLEILEFVKNFLFLKVYINFFVAQTVL